MNDSSTGGVLTPLPPVQGQYVALTGAAFEDLIQPWLCGLTGIARNLVRPLWQPDPPPRPDITVDWFAFGVKTSKRDWSSFIKHVSATDTPSVDLLYRNEVAEIALQIYGPNAEQSSALLWNGLQVGQNNEFLLRNKLGFVGVDDPVRMAEKIKGRWYNRFDLQLYLRRAVSLQYPVLDISSASVEFVVGPPPVTVEIDVEPEGYGAGGFGDGPFGN